MPGPHLDDSTLMEFAAGAVPGAERTRINEHLRTCRLCRSRRDAIDDATSPSGERFAPIDLGSDSVAPTLASGIRDDDLLLGQMLGEYRVLEWLGQGGMGVLYRGEQPVIGKEVAIKVLQRKIASDANVVQRMIGEARAANAVRHPNIVDIFSFGQLPDGRPYMVMELLQGQPLSNVLAENGRLSPTQTLQVLVQSMSALEAAHAAGVVHRDLKPDNIFVDARHNFRVTLLDFGLAKRAESVDAKLTQPGLVMGTPAYMSPEQVRGEASLSGTADVYSMGVVAWTLLAGHEPFRGGSIVEVMHRHLDTPVPPLPPQADELPEGLEALIRQMLEKDPARRPQASDVRRAAAALLNKKPEAKEPLLSPLMVGAIALAVLLVAGLGLLAALSSSEPVKGPPPPVPFVDPSAKITTPPVIEPPEVVAVPEEKVKVVEIPGRRWNCENIASITEVFPVIGSPWKIFLINFENNGRMMVTTNGAKGRLAKELRALEALRRQAQYCSKAGGTLNAARSNDHHEGVVTDHGIFNGLEVKADDFTVDADKVKKK